jgi:dolichol-phosphate mannosyltransferase
MRDMCRRSAEQFWRIGNVRSTKDRSPMAKNSHTASALASPQTLDESVRRTVSVVVPSFNERDNVFPLVEQLDAVLSDFDAEVLYVDDSTDDTPEMVRAAAENFGIPVRVLHREEPTGGLSGAVVEGIRESAGEYVVVMDGDLQHPADLVPALVDTARARGLDLVAASRYIGEGDAFGLSSSWRRSVSSVSTLLARCCFPRRIGQVSTDPMTGFFCVRRDAVDLTRLHPRGFKILVEILARHDLRVAELPFAFGERQGGESKASWKNGREFLYQLASLRAGRLSRFAVVGGLGTLVNLAIMWVLTALFDENYVVAAIVATEVTILHNFLLQERFVFGDMRDGVHNWLSRLARSLAFNNLEAAIRLPFLVLIVSTWQVAPVAVQAFTLALAFLARFIFASRVVYRPRSRRDGPAPTAPLPNQAPRILGRLRHSQTSPESHVARSQEPWFWWGSGGSGEGLSAAALAAAHAPAPAIERRFRRPGRAQQIPDAANEATPWYWWETAEEPSQIARQRPVGPTNERIGAPYTSVLVTAALLAIITCSVLTFGIYATGIAAIVSIAVVFGIAAGVEAGWRLYGRRDPEAIQDMGFPPPTARTGLDSFSIIVPAKDEVEVLHETLETLARQTHQNVQIIATLIEGDHATIKEAEIARAKYPDRIEILVRKYEKEMKPYQLNAALEICRGEYVGVIDAEDATATGLLVSVEAAFQTSGADVVQGPVQLMTLGMKIREWFMVHNVLEYLFWFSSRMMFQARHGFVPLGGNTVFIRRELLNKAGGWPISLTEDCALGVKLSTQYGAKVVAVYDPALATREETPDNVRQLLHQRIRWDTGFGVELLQKKWWHLPSLERRLLAWYILATPFLQASAGLLLPITLATAILIDAPVVLVLLTFLPYIPILLSLVLQFVGLHEFGRMFSQRVRIRHYLFLGLGFLPYQLVLAWAALHAVLRIATGNMTWFKTAHSNKHRSGMMLTAMPVSEVG